MSVNAAHASVKTVADPNASYESLLPLWGRSRAVCSGERFVKELDSIVSLRNLLLPFSPTMTQEQYSFFRAEAEWPGVTSLFGKTIVGGLLRKQPVLTLPDGMEGVADWILNSFGQDDSPLTSFMDAALWEEMQTSRAWIFVDYPSVPLNADLSPEEAAAFKPYPVLYKAESIINWRTRQTPTGKEVLDRIIVKGTKEVYLENAFHPTYVETVWVHELDASGLYQIRVFQKQAPTSNVTVIAGQQQANTRTNGEIFVEVEVINTILMNGERLSFIPAWPLNGSITPVEPMLSPFADKEVALYNKISRRNHLLLGAATYTPVIAAEITDEKFQEIVEGGLGTWIRLPENGTASVLDTPTSALIDMDRAIAAGFEELAKMGIRMLTPESDQSGVALQLRNASQTAQLSSLNMKCSNVMRQVIVVMINWRYNLDITPSDIDFTLSSDFLTSQNGPDWLRLATEWYDTGKIPRSAWLYLLKQNDMLTPDYDDVEGQKEITADMEAVMAAQGGADFATKINQNGT